MSFWFCGHISPTTLKPVISTTPFESAMATSLELIKAVQSKNLEKVRNLLNKPGVIVDEQDEVFEWFGWIRRTLFDLIMLTCFLIIC